MVWNQFVYGQKDRRAKSQSARSRTLNALTPVEYQRISDLLNETLGFNWTMGVYEYKGAADLYKLLGAIKEHRVYDAEPPYHTPDMQAQTERVLKEGWKIIDAGLAAEDVRTRELATTIRAAVEGALKLELEQHSLGWGR